MKNPNGPSREEMECWQQTLEDQEAERLLGAARGSADELKISLEGDEIHIWFEDLMCLGSGKTFEAARDNAIHNTADILKQLTAISPSNVAGEPRRTPDL